MERKSASVLVIAVLVLVLAAGCSSTGKTINYGGATEVDGAVLIIDATVWVVSFDGKGVEDWQGTVSSFGNKSTTVYIPAGQHSLIVQGYKSTQEFSQIYEAGVVYMVDLKSGNPVMKTK
jgi:hypothetical protein